MDGLFHLLARSSCGADVANLEDLKSDSASQAGSVRSETSSKAKRPRKTGRLSISALELQGAVSELLDATDASKGPLKPIVFLKARESLQSQYAVVMDDLALPSGNYALYKALRQKVSVAQSGKVANEPASLETKIDKRRALMAVSQSELEDLQNTSEAVKEACEVYKRHAVDMQGLLTELADELESLQYQKTTMSTATKRTNSKVRYAREKVLLCMGVSAF
jgi:hypothetical protein